MPLVPPDVPLGRFLLNTFFLQTDCTYGTGMAEALTEDVLHVLFNVTNSVLSHLHHPHTGKVIFEAVGVKRQLPSMGKIRIRNTELS